MDTPTKDQLVKACEDLLGRAQAVAAEQVFMGDEVAKAVKHVGLAVQYLSQLTMSAEYAGIGAGLSNQAIDRIAERQLEAPVATSDWSALWAAEDEDAGQVEDVTVPELETPNLSQVHEEVAGFKLSDSKQGLEGDNSTISISDLVSWFGIQERDGVLRVRIPHETVTIVIEKGNLVYAGSDNSPVGTRLGEILVEQGSLGAQELSNTLRRFRGLRETGKRVGTSLEEGEFISRENLLKALTTQIKLLLGRVFTAEHAKFALRQGQLREPDGQISLNVMELLLEEARDRDEAQP